MEKIIPFNVGHLTVIDTFDDEDVTKLANWQDRLSDISEYGIAFTLLIDGRVIVCGGIVHGVPGVAACWLLPSLYINDYSHAAAKAVRTVLDDLIEAYQLRRLETGCQNDKRHTKWMEFLGFEAEGVQRCAGVAGGDLMMWAKVEG